MGVCASAGSHYYELASDILPDVLVRGRHVHDGGLDLGYVYHRKVHGMSGRAVAVEECEAGGELLEEDHLGIVQSHAFQKLLGSLHGLVSGRYRQGKAQLHLAVVHGVPVGFYSLEVQILVVILLLHRIKSAAHVIFLLSLV